MIKKYTYKNKITGYRVNSDKPIEGENWILIYKRDDAQMSETKIITK